MTRLVTGRPTTHFPELGLTRREAARYASHVASSAAFLEDFMSFVDAPLYQEPLRFQGLHLGGGKGLEIAQSRCPWWIEGMLRLVKAIEDAPDPVRGGYATPAHRAHTAVSKALSAGRLVRQPCEVCASADDVQAHHDNYSEPLSVRWLCRRHHISHHTEAGTWGGKGRPSPKARRGVAA